MIPPLVRRLGV